MLYEVMSSVNNYFLTGKRADGKFTIENGTIALSFVEAGQYVLIDGSSFNDGVYKYPLTNMANETFEGSIAVCAPPKAFLDLVDEISTFKSSHKLDGLSSESFGGYSYSRATGASGTPADWPDVFRARLNHWRRI